MIPTGATGFAAEARTADGVAVAGLKTVYEARRRIPTNRASPQVLPSCEERKERWVALKFDGRWFLMSNMSRRPIPTRSVFADRTAAREAERSERESAPSGADTEAETNIDTGGYR